MLGFLKPRQQLEFAAAVLDREDWILIGINRTKAGKIDLSVCEWVNMSQIPDEQKRIARLKNKFREFRLDQNGISTVLGLGEYTLMSIEAPQVPANEIRSAVRWQIQDLLDFHIDDAVIDVFDAPELANSQQRNIYAVISKKKSLEDCIAPLQQIDANLTVVDIPELILRNIASLLEENANGLVMLYFNEYQGLLTLVHQNVLYLARSLDIGYRHLINDMREGSSGAIDYICLEVQRSLDYFDRYFGKAPIQNVVVLPLQDICPNLCRQIQDQLGIHARFFNMDEFITQKQFLSAEQQRRCMLTLGAALRREASAL